MIIINVGIKKEKNYYYFVIPRYEESIFKRIQNYFRFFLRQNDKFFASFPLLPSLLSSVYNFNWRILPIVLIEL